MNGEIYGLNKPNFSLVPIIDRNIFFAKRKQADTYIEDIRGDILIGKPPKKCIAENYGTGKTQFCFYLSHKLQDIAKIIYIKVPAIHKRSEYTHLHKEILFAIGENYVKNLFEKVFVGTLKSFISKSEDATFNSSISMLNQSYPKLVSSAILALNKGNWYYYWKFIVGEKLSTQEAEELGIPLRQITYSEAVNVLNLIAELVKIIENKQLLLILDECENLIPLKGDAKIQFTESFRALVDETSKVGIIFVFTARSLEEAPSVLIEPQVQRRIGISNYLEFPGEYSEKEIKEFVYELLEYRRKNDSEIKKMIAKAIQQTKEKVDEKTFPFTKEALDEIINYIISHKDELQIPVIRPKELIEAMDDALKNALRMDPRPPVIDTKVIKRTKLFTKTE